MRETTVTIDNPANAVHKWFQEFGSHVANREYEPAQGLVADDVVSFGTKAELVEGLGHLVEQQWKGIWPNIEDFRFEDVRAFPTGDDSAWGCATWLSTGFDEDGKPFERPGRATITFERRDGRWLATHTHFSLYPGVRQETYGPNGETET
jgi:ketosteroid isomerase-like protein